jgi:hypothetical protein
LLGLGIHSPSPGFLDAINELSRRRNERNQEIFQKMAEIGIEANWEDIEALARQEAVPGPGNTQWSGTHSIGRLHFARLLINLKIVKNQEQAFSRFLGLGKPLYVPRKGLVFEEAVGLIRESGGIPVLAHPMSLFVAWGRLPDLLKALKDRGLMGIEAWHPNTKPRACRRLADLGKSLGLYITEGSDFHGSIKPERKLGYSHIGRKIDDAVLALIPELNSSTSYE